MLYARFIALFICFSVLDVSPVMATVSDYQFLEAMYEANQYKAEESAASDQDPSPQLLFSAIQDFFAIQKNYRSTCFLEQNPKPVPAELLKFIPDNPMDREMNFDVRSLAFGYDILMQSNPLQENSFFLPRQWMLECTPASGHCATLIAQESEFQVKEDEVEISKSETWDFVITKNQELVAKASFELSRQTKTWLGAPKGTESIRQNFMCYLEPVEVEENRP